MDALAADECYKQVYADCDSMFYQKVKKDSVNQGDLVLNTLPQKSELVKLTWDWRPRGVIVDRDMPLPLKSMG